MAVVVAAMTNRAPKLCYSYSSNHQFLLKPTKKKLMGSPKFIFDAQNLSSNSILKLKGPYPPIHASNSPPEENNSAINDAKTISQEDLSFLWKLGAGSVAGAAIIKYGSILFPEITRPNILLALAIVLTPVFLAIVLLIKQSRRLK
ncbi:uncharacterized protein LOC8282363 [Ricinus communis]|uniref:uncharacterized protein LOC8282363 n=1 Tax=Ricinus communis TaxID=3988 RepID=UPI00077259DD|nr:uncharacterized protein LOC8282363 [Ricinus communis]|eukprot:XP_015573814.1 uncharacterized protein LOC8282363 [Ricinus communis]